MAKFRSPHVGGQQLPLLEPDSSWTPPAELPDLRRLPAVAIDTETCDEGLAADRGSSWPWHGGHVAGVGVAWRQEGEVRSLYVPVRHPDTQCHDRGQVSRWLTDLVTAPGGPQLVTQNGTYDWGWLWADLGVEPPAGERMEEVGAAATLVDENRLTYNLNDLCTWRGLPGKDEALLREAMITYGFIGPRSPDREVKRHIYKMPARYVGPYGGADPAQTLELWESLMGVIREEGTEEAYRLECDLLPLVHHMRRRGVRVNLDHAEQARLECLRERDAAFEELRAHIGEQVGMEEIGRTAWLERIFAAHAPDILIPRTEPTKRHPTGQASFTAGSTGWMHKNKHWLPQLVVRADKANNAAEKFLQGYIINHSTRDRTARPGQNYGRIHAEVHPHRGEDGDGTKSLRFSYSDPPLQQMTSRDEALAPRIRGCFEPEEGERWCKPDVSQQEYRFIVHYATVRGLPKALEAAEMYRRDPNTDFHNLVVEMTGLERKPAKDTNFAKAFGAGVPKFAAMTNKTEEEAQAIYDLYDQRLPFVQRLFDDCEGLAKRRGYIRLYDGARRHWDDWEPRWLPRDERARGYAEHMPMAPCRRAEALRRCSDPRHPWHGKQLRRFDTRTAMNALIQGSAARHTKLWMRACWREGIVPLLQLHDELDASVRSKAEGEMIQRLGQEAVKLEVPVKVEVGYGRNWGDAEHDWEEVGG